MFRVEHPHLFPTTDARHPGYRETLHPGAVYAPRRSIPQGLNTLQRFQYRSALQKYAKVPPVLTVHHHRQLRL